MAYLSYSPFIDNEDDIILKTIIKEFKAGYYWLIWLTVIKILLNQQNEKNIPNGSIYIHFIKKSALKKVAFMFLKKLINLKRHI